MSLFLQAVAELSYQLCELISYTGAGSEEKVREMATYINPTIISHLCSIMKLKT